MPQDDPQRIENDIFLANLSTITGIHLISIITLVAYLIFETFQPWYEPLTFWSGGTVGNTEWGEMLTDISWILVQIEDFFTQTVSERQNYI